MTVRVTSIVTVAGSRSSKSMSAWSRNPSPFGVTVVTSGPSPSNRVDPLSACRSTSCGACVSIRSGAVASTVERKTSLKT